MQTATFETKKLDLVELVMAIDTEVVLDKVLGYVRKKMNEPEMKYEIATEDESVMLREETIEAINEARSGKSAGMLDVSDFDSFLKSIDEA